MNKPITLITNDTVLIEDLDIVFNIFGYSGGGILSICLLPQIIKTLKTQSAKDISYVFQGLSMLGLSFFISYGIYFGLMPAFIPGILELTLMLFLTILKCYFDNIQKKNLKELELKSTSTKI